MMDQSFSGRFPDRQRPRNLLNVSASDGGSVYVPFAITAHQLLSEGDGEPIPFLLESLLQQTGLACLAGSSDTGKSCLLRQFAIAVAAGDESFLGFKINARHHSAIYVTTEDGRDATRHLLRQQAHNYDPDLLKNLRFVFDDERLFECLDDELAARPVDVVVFDCFQDVYGGDLKDSQRIRTFLHPLQLLAEKHRCLFLFLHHTAKRTENFEPNKNNLLSGQGFEAKMRLVIELRADPVNTVQRHLCVVKANYLPGSAKRESHALFFNENTFTFTPTGERTPFELLVKPEPKEAEQGKAKFLQAKRLQAQGCSFKEIAEKMGYSSKGSVWSLYKRARTLGWTNEDPIDTDETTDETEEKCA